MNRYFSLKPALVPPKTMQGISLIEMMISLTIGLVVIAGIGYTYIGSKQSFREQDVLSRMQEGARTAFEMLDRDIRMAGYQGCMTGTTDINVLTAATDWDKNLVGANSLPLVGYENTAEASIALPAGNYAGFPVLPNTNAAVTPVTGNVWQGDAISIVYASISQEYIVSSDNTGASQMTLSANHNLLQGQIMVATDCTHTAEFEKTNACAITNGSCGNKIVQYGASDANATTQLGKPQGTPYSFVNGSRVYPINAFTYYVAKNPNGEPALFRAVGGTSQAPITQELVEGVQDLQLSYGIDAINPTAPVAVTQYVTANNVANWDSVLGVRVSLLMVSSSSEQGITLNPQQYALDINGDGNTTGAGETVVPTDNLFRKVFTTTIAVKNRL